MGNGVSIRINANQERAVRTAWAEWKRDRLPRDGLHIISEPPMGGPYPDGKITMSWLPSEFVAHLRAKGFQLEVV